MCLIFRASTGSLFFSIVTEYHGESAEPGTPDIELALREIYVLYTDYALKNPFYELEMPIRCDLFVQSVDVLIDRMERNSNAGGGGNLGLSVKK